MHEILGMMQNRVSAKRLKQEGVQEILEQYNDVIAARQHARRSCNLSAFDKPEEKSDEDTELAVKIVHALIPEHDCWQ